MSEIQQSLRAGMLDADKSLQAPEEFLAMRRRVFEDVARSGVATGVAVGERAPQFELPNATGATVSLAGALARGPVVLSFYRGSWCPFCNVELAALQRALPRVKELGASLIAVSPQPPSEALSVTQKLDLGYEVVSDTEQRTIEAYRLQWEFPEDFKQAHLMWGVDVGASNGDGSWRVPVPATFVIDRAGVVRASYVNADFLVRMEPDDIVTALRSLA